MDDGMYKAIDIVDDTYSQYVEDGELAQDTKDQYLQLLDIYCKKNEKVLKITSTQAKKEFVVNSKQVLDMLQSTCEGEKWQLKSEIEHDYYDWKAEN